MRKSAFRVRKTPRSRSGSSEDVAGAESLALNEAQAAYRDRDMVRAENLCGAVLERQADHFDALVLLGWIAAQTNRMERAVDLLGRAAEVKPADAAVHCDYGSALRLVGRHAAALESYGRAVRLMPDYVAAHHGHGLVLQELNRLAEALASYDRALAIRPVAETHNNRGNVLRKLKRPKEALQAYQRALSMEPCYAEAHFNLGDLLADLRRLEEAVESYGRAISANPMLAAAWVNLGNTLRALRRFDAALQSFDRAVAIDQENAEAHIGRGNALRDQGHIDEALASYDRALELQPQSAVAHNNRGVALRDLKRWEAAEESYERAIAIVPDYAEAYVNRCADRLIRGDFERGWPDYEWRWKLPTAIQAGARVEHLGRPLWLGETPIVGKTVLLHSEQGLGDTIQFCRFAKTLTDLGARVILEVPAPLRDLIQRLEGPSKLIALGDPLPTDLDYHCPLMSLPLALGTTLQTIPASSRYLTADPTKVAAWRARLGTREKPRVGLTWSGAAEYKEDHLRSLPLATLMPHLPSGFEYFRLQKEIREGDRRTLECNPQIRDFSADIADLDDTAALCECLDIIISTCTSVAHLSAALGKRTWVLLSSSPDWRWLLNREDSPWYSSVKLFRQDRPANWSYVLARMSDELIREFRR
jgi:tetratricopeptide (TPR) repeat protein